MNSIPVTQLPAPVPLQSAAAAVARASLLSSSSSRPESFASANLTEQAAPTYLVLQGGASLPPSSTPSYVLPPGGRGFSALFDALQAIAVEHVYPAPIFSFNA